MHTFSKFDIRQLPEFGVNDFEKVRVNDIMSVRETASHMVEAIEGKSRIWDVCCMVSQIEERFDFPDWLGDMYNVCDWLGPDSVIDAGIDLALRKQVELMESES